LSKHDLPPFFVYRLKIYSSLEKLVILNIADLIFSLPPSRGTLLLSLWVPKGAVSSSRIHHRRRAKAKKNDYKYDFHDFSPFSLNVYYMLFNSISYVLLLRSPLENLPRSLSFPPLLMRVPTL